MPQSKQPKTQLRLSIRVTLYTFVLAGIFTFFYVTLFAHSIRPNDRQIVATVYAMNGEPIRIPNPPLSNGSDSSGQTIAGLDDKVVYAKDDPASSAAESLSQAQTIEDAQVNADEEAVSDSEANVPQSQMGETISSESSDSLPANASYESQSDSKSEIGTSFGSLDSQASNEDASLPADDYGYPIVAKSDDAVTKTILIDVGHGGSDLGDVSKDGLIEKNVTLDLALKLKKHLELQNPNLNVVLSRETDQGPLSSSSWADLTERRNLQEQVNPDYYLSLHSHLDGAEGITFYINPDDEQTSTLVSNMNTTLKNAGWTSDANVVTTDQYPLQLISMASSHAVMIEFGSLNSAEDVAKLKDSQTMEKSAAALANALSTTILDNPYAPAYHSVQKQLTEKVNSSL